MFQSTPVADLFGSVAYIVCIISCLCFANQPRAKFLQALFQQILFTCIAVPMAILGLWCARQAKLHTQPAGSTDNYNPSAAAVSCVFLFFNTYLINAFRAVIPPIYLTNGSGIQP